MLTTRRRARRADPTSTRRAAALFVLAVLVTLVTWQLRPVAPGVCAAPVTDIVRGCALVAWALIEYVAAAVAATCVAHLATSAGLAGRGLPSLTRLAPRRLRRLVDLAITAGVTAAVIGSAATAATAATPRHGYIAAVSRPVPAGAPLDWPGLPPTVPRSASSAATPSPATRPPAASTPSPSPLTAPTHPGARPPARRHRADVGLVAGGHPRRSVAALAPVEVVVRGGDTLWSIAQRQLGSAATPAAVTAAWHDWYATNRTVIGPDPSRIYPGQRLQPPPTTSTPTHEPRSPR